jgi:Mn-dependent DtxR family transcriptional regulator
MPANLTEFEEKILKYLFNRKTAATTKQIAKYFIRSDSYVTSALRKLEEHQLIMVVTAGTTKLYAYKD